MVSTRHNVSPVEDKKLRRDRYRFHYKFYEQVYCFFFSLSRVGLILNLCNWVSRFPPYSHGFPPGSPVSSSCPKTCRTDRLRVNTCMNWCPIQDQLSHLAPSVPGTGSWATATPFRIKRWLKSNEWKFIYIYMYLGLGFRTCGDKATG